MRKVIISMALMLAVGVFADEIIVDHASGRSPACGPIQFVTSGTGTNTVLKVNSVSATNVTATAINGATTISGTTITAAGKLSSYGYTTVVGGANGGSVVYMTQSGTNNLLGTTQTNTFPVPFIAVPSVCWSSLAGTATNVMVITSNAFTTLGPAQDGCWIAHGRIK